MHADAWWDTRAQRALDDIPTCVGWYAKPAAWINKNRTFVGRQMFCFCWWGKVDSDHRSQWQQIYSLPPLAAREIPHMELVIGVEPTTCWLQISCSAIEPHQHIQLNSARFLSPHSLYQSALKGFKYRNVWYYITKKYTCQEKSKYKIILVTNKSNYSINNTTI